MSSTGNKATQVFKSAVSKVEVEGGLYVTCYNGQDTFPRLFCDMFQFVNRDRCRKVGTVFMSTIIWS